MQAERVARRPAERLRSLAPGRKEAPAILYRLPPAIRLDVAWGASVKDVQGMLQALQVAARNSIFRVYRAVRGPFSAPLLGRLDKSTCCH